MSPEIEALRQTAPHPESPLPWTAHDVEVRAGSADVCGNCYPSDAEHIAAAVNAAPVLLARVAELDAELTTLRESNTALQAQLAAARVAVESAALPPLPLGSHYLAFVERANDIGEAQRKALAAVRRALGLEVGK